VTIVAGLNAAIELLERDGYEAAYTRNRGLARATREGVKALGLEIFSPDDDTSSMVTAVRMPDDIDGQEVYTLLRDRHGDLIVADLGSEVAGQTAAAAEPLDGRRRPFEQRGVSGPAHHRVMMTVRLGHQVSRRQVGR